MQEREERVIMVESERTDDLCSIILSNGKAFVFVNKTFFNNIAERTDKASIILIERNIINSNRLCSAIHLDILAFTKYGFNSKIEFTS